MADPKLEDVDPIFSGRQSNYDPDADDALMGLDPIFSASVGPGKPKPVVRDKNAGAFPELGLTANQERAAAAGTGAILGPGLQKTAETVFPSKEMRAASGVKKLKEQQQMAQLLQNMRDEELLRLGIQPEAAPKGATSGTNWLKNWANMDKEIAGGVPEGAATYNRSKGQGKVSGRLTKMYGPLKSGQSIVDKLLENSNTNAAASTQRAAAIPAAEAAAAARLAEATPGPMAKAAKVVTSPIVSGALSGAGAGLSFYEAYRRFIDGDRSGAVIAALGGVGALASMVPGLGLAGAAVGAASLPAMYANDVLKGKTEATGRDIQVDPMGNPTGQ
jgi:hypothetical protein